MSPQDPAKRGRLLQVHTVPSLAENVRLFVEVAAIIAAGLWALYTFVYEQRIKPLSEAPSFSLPTTIEQGATVNGVAFLTIHKRLQNTGDIPVDIAAEVLDVYGEVLVNGSDRVERIATPTSITVKADVPRRIVARLFAFAKLRSGAVQGNQRTDFFVPPHSSAEETYLVAVPVKTYPVVKIYRRDYVGRAPIRPKIPIQIIKNDLGGYDLQSPLLEGEYDSEQEYPIRRP